MPFFMPLETPEEFKLREKGKKEVSQTPIQNPPTPPPGPVSDPFGAAPTAQPQPTAGPRLTTTQEGKSILDITRPPTPEERLSGPDLFLHKLLKPVEDKVRPVVERGFDILQAIGEVGLQLTEAAGPLTGPLGELAVGPGRQSSLPDPSKINFHRNFTIDELKDLNEERSTYQQIMGAVLFDPLNLVGGWANPTKLRGAATAGLRKLTKDISFDFAEQIGAWNAQNLRKPTLFEKMEIARDLMQETPAFKAVMAKQPIEDVDDFNRTIRNLIREGGDEAELEKLRKTWQSYADQIDAADTPAQRTAMEKAAKNAEIAYSDAIESAISNGRAKLGFTAPAEEAVDLAGQRVDQAAGDVGVEPPMDQNFRSMDYDTQLNFFDEANPVPQKGDVPTTVGETNPIGDNVAEAAIDGEYKRVYETDPDMKALFGVDEPLEITLTNSQKLTNVVKDMFRKLDWPSGHDIDARVASAFRWYDRALLQADSQASRMEAKFNAIVHENFPTMSKQGDFPELKGIDPTLTTRTAGGEVGEILAPTLEDIAARLDTFKPHLTHQQIEAFELMDSLWAPFRNTALREGVNVGIRPDIEPGGFWLPRGAALLDDAEVTIRTGTRRGKVGAERQAKFKSKAEGLQAGYKYGNLTDNMREAVFGLSRRAMDEHMVKFFGKLRDDSGEMLLETSKQRLLRQNPELVKRHEELRKAVNNLRQLDKRLSSRAHMKMQEFLDDVTFDDIDLLREELIPAMRVSRGQYKGADLPALRTAQNQVAKAIKEMAPEWRRAKEAAKNPTVDQARINFQGLEQYSGPRAFVDELNRQTAKAFRGDPDWLKHHRAVAGAMRGMQATMDMSGGFIQGLLAMHNNPIAFGKAFKSMWEALANPRVTGQHFNDLDVKAIQGGLPTTQEMADVGVHFSGGAGEFIVGGQREGLTLLGKLPAIRNFNRAFSSFGDVLRAEWYQDLYQEASEHGQRLLTRAEKEDIAKLVNNATGWSERRTGGDLGELVLFAPRFFQSRLETLGAAARSFGPRNTFRQRYARKAILRMMAQGAAITYGVNWMLGQETDPMPVRKVGNEWRRNPNFMRIRVPWLEQDISVFGTWDSMLGMFLMAGSAAVNDNHWEGFQFLRFTASPAVSSGWDFISGRDFDGNRTRDTGKQITKRLLKNVQPFFLQDFNRHAWSPLKESFHQRDAMKLAQGLSTAGLQFLAVKATPFTFNDVVTDIIRDIGETGGFEEGSGDGPSTPFQKLTPSGRRAVQQHSDYVQAQAAKKELKAAAEPLSRVEAQIQWRELRQGYDEEMLAALNDGPGQGKPLRLTIQDVMSRRSQDARMLFETLAAEGEEPTMEAFRGAHEAYWSVPLEMDMQTGRPDFETRDNQRNIILERAVDLGYRAEDITDRFDFSENEEVNKLVRVYNMSQDMMKGYWDETERLVGSMPPAYQEIWARYELADDAVKPVLASEYSFLTKISEFRKFYRAEHPEVDLLLVWWGYPGKPVTPAAQGLWLERVGQSLP